MEARCSAGRVHPIAAAVAVVASLRPDLKPCVIARVTGTIEIRETAGNGVVETVGVENVGEVVPSKA